MLFYERRLPDHLKEKHANLLASQLPIPQKPVTKIAGSATAATTARRSSMDKVENSTKAAEDAACPAASNEDVSDKNNKASDETTKTEDLEKVKKESANVCEKEASQGDMASTSTGSSPSTVALNKKIEMLLKPQLSKELEDWIWQDNRQFLQDRNIFEHTYFKYVI